MTLKVYVPSDVYIDYRKYQNQVNSIPSTKYSGKFFRRDVAEIVLFEKILSLACKCRIYYVSKMNYKRALNELSQGNIDIMANPVWKIDTLGKNYLSTDPLVKYGEFKAILYTARKELTVNQTPEKLKSLKILTNPHWTVDHQTVKNIFSKISLAITWESIVKLLSRKRADITLAPLSPSADHTIKYKSYTLYPIPGHKVSLQDERVLAVSKKHHELVKKINKVIKKFHDNGTIHEIYTRSGFFSPKIKEWKEL